MILFYDVGECDAMASWMARSGGRRGGGRIGGKGEFIPECI